MAISSVVHSVVSQICIRIPQFYHRQPVLSQLISGYGLMVNITAAFLDAETKKDGWFNLEIQGGEQDVKAGIDYLKTLNIEVEIIKFTFIKGEENELNLWQFDLSEALLRQESEVELTAIESKINRAKFHVCISQNYRSYPIIAGLITYSGLTVDIVGALLETSSENDGWFDLELWGRPQQIISGLRYLKERGLQIWL
ncbi:NIL domain-containing protein [Anabaena azotica]|uniref:NIL domain-containing protein n=1 Tax=Anabaena azotica FACHB-119 TaxID=947527 RepID=A0ABR8DG47_9NOST|nr:NIL domain-containing protein [Anabaena azotica]MBD2505177.1 NIL domain-containing protein [Anabaena azotica FACHB-119]